MPAKRTQPAPDLETARRRIVAEFERLTPASKRHFESTVRYQPYGRERTGVVAPYPMYVDHGRGPYLYNIEGRRILDMLNQNMAGVLGHAHPKVQAATKRQLSKGMFFTLSNPLEGELAAKLAERIPSMERVRFNVTGGEATMMALRLTKAYTRRDKFAMADGGYHGNYDTVWATQELHYMGRQGAVGPGIMPGVERYAVSFPFNKLEESRRIIEENAQELAAVIIEPVLGGGGSIPASRDYLQMLREVTRKHDIILIFDEMITLALAKGGAQEFYDVIPDMTCGGKNVGGGFPMSFYGGRADIIDLTAYGPDKSVPPVIHTGTYFAHPAVMATGLAFLDLLTDEAYAYLHEMGADAGGAAARGPQARGAPPGRRRGAHVRLFLDRQAHHRLRDRQGIRLLHQGADTGGPAEQGLLHQRLGRPEHGPQALPHQGLRQGIRGCARRVWPGDVAAQQRVMTGATARGRRSNACSRLPGSCAAPR